MTTLAILLAGFSVFSALFLALTHFSGEPYRDQPGSRAMGLILLLVLCGLQLAHFAWLYAGVEWVMSAAYRVAIFAVAPAFFLFAQPLLKPRMRESLRPASLGHLLPLALSAWLPGRIALPLAFAVGAGYLLCLARQLFVLRRERARFGGEMTLLAGVFIVAIGASLLGLLQAALPEKLFFSLYASAIGVAFFLVQLALGFRPQLSVEVREAISETLAETPTETLAEMATGAAREAYASSTLNNVDCSAALASLDRLMRIDRLYTNPELSLPGLAERLGLSTHQLSELFNARLGKGFSRYLREQRVAAAKAMLRDEPSASVLSVGLSVGFTAQSNFYEAFREIEGATPGAYRKRVVRAESAGEPGQIAPE